MIPHVAVIPCLRRGPAVELGAPILLGPVFESGARELGSVQVPRCFSVSTAVRNERACAFVLKLRVRVPLGGSR